MSAISSFFYICIETSWHQLCGLSYRLQQKQVLNTNSNSLATRLKVSEIQQIQVPNLKIPSKLCREEPVEENRNRTWKKSQFFLQNGQYYWSFHSTSFHSSETEKVKVVKHGKLIATFHYNEHQPKHFCRKHRTLTKIQSIVKTKE